MTILYTIIQALWNQDFITLANPNIVWIIYSIMFIIIFLENALLPAAFLPGDSLLLLAGAMIAKGVMNFTLTMFILTIASSLGYWLSYLQGRWLGNTKIIKNWLMHIPIKYSQRASYMFNRHGLLALLIGRFLAFVRTILPIIAGISGLQNGLFQLFNWISGVLWVSIILSIGFIITQVPFIKQYENQVIFIFMMLPIVLLLIGLSGSIIMIWKKRN
ncbi:DedA family protein [Pantoea sp. Aalb]|uniref:DedA family protein n=1 Tax=Pantoea sp. Aalb TaxID=2576762 RepID=UPI001322156C|nr:DedA family protein [Pantoea sp. Aalb]MXP67709.1 DedA family protein [Pantoea sp. Aalb]